MKKKLLICLLTFGLVIVWSMVIADGFYVIPVKKRNWAPVQKTGQFKCYDSSGMLISCTGTGQDGEYQNGVNWPNPRFTDNENGTVKDNLTGLIWLKNANCTTFNKADIGLQNERSWSSALRAANSLASPYCGLTDGSSVGDWRLPNVRELQSLTHYGFYVRSVPNTAGTDKWTEGDPFNNLQNSSYWSSTSREHLPDCTWYVEMFQGAVMPHSKDYDYHVWPVRGGN